MCSGYGALCCPSTSCVIEHNDCGVHVTYEARNQVFPDVLLCIKSANSDNSQVLAQLAFSGSYMYACVLLWQPKKTELKAWQMFTQQNKYMYTHLIMQTFCEHLQTSV